jgi:hypothetical protein
VQIEKDGVEKNEIVEEGEIEGNETRRKGRN